MLSKLQKNKDFRVILDKGKKIVGKGFLLFIVESRDSNILKYGVIASSKIGNAVVRNKIKRQVKHIVFGNLKNTTGYNLCIVATRNYNSFDFLEINNNFKRKLEENNIL
jgi:ribonuclease P protein component